MRTLKLLIIIIAIFSGLTTFAFIATWVTAGEPGDEPLPKEEPVEAEAEKELEGEFLCHTEMIWDLHQVDAFFGIVETHPSRGEWPVITTHSHSAETLGYTLIQIRGLSVPSQFADRTRSLKEVERERKRFDDAMYYVWHLIDQSETLVLRNPEAHEGGYVICDVFIRIGGHELDLSKMMIADGHARPSGNWNWGARDVYEIKEQIHNETH